MNTPVANLYPLSFVRDYIENGVVRFPPNVEVVTATFACSEMQQEPRVGNRGRGRPRRVGRALELE